MSDFEHPKVAACYLLFSAGVGFLDGAFKIGQRHHEQKTFITNVCQIFSQKVSAIENSSPEVLKHYVPALYFYCSYATADLTVPADIVRHLQEAECISKAISPSTLYSPIIIVPTLLIAGIVLINPDSLKDNHLPEALRFGKIILQRVLIHGCVSTISGDVIGYFGCPFISAMTISAMAFIGLLEGLDECGELLEKSGYTKQKKHYFKNACLTIHQIYHRPVRMIPKAKLHQFHTSYRMVSVAGSAGTISGDLITYFGNVKDPTITKISAAAVSLSVICGMGWDGQ